MFVPENAFTAEDKRALGERITDIYSNNFDIPRFYTTVFFHEAKPESYLVGGEPRDKFVQVAIVHAARTADQIAERIGVSVDDLLNKFLDLAHDAINPYVRDRGYELELHVEDAPRETWNIDGMPPPPPWSEAEKRWTKDNRSSPYEMADV
jgi:phenylpyruvate tautomerase PptA (4-oxalocrotonate tautomerase family)